MAWHNSGNERKLEWIFQFARSSLRVQAIFFLNHFSIIWEEIYTSHHTSLALVDTGFVTS